MAHDEPLFRVVRGTPTADELAALVGVLATRARPAPPRRTATRSAWVRAARPAAAHPCMPARPAPDGWRFSALPR
ncbi:acyl-CoA carboxylase subunit epsilon [Plantactinospora sp. KBS50]|uniref:acyl-CoA carboxylase subunit epsilon n=1 Tax=Plantactinospora sp. KBS50 TaxID=2024580 RepID=UPI000BAB1C3E|nr:acyl-CoA carboxylase subunit epsilon [Plantactinospora sp. KBS50]ASW56696.1 hypothetical protein CIK06_24880 [Plantactinospora sp. KBS50]